MSAPDPNPDRGTVDGGVTSRHQVLHVEPTMAVYRDVFIESISCVQCWAHIRRTPFFLSTGFETSPSRIKLTHRSIQHTCGVVWQSPSLACSGGPSQIILVPAAC